LYLSLLLVCLLLTSATGVFAADNAANTQYAATGTETSDISQGSKLVIKNYVIPKEIVPETAVPSSFDEDGYSYSLVGIISNDMVRTDEQDMAVQKTQAASSRFTATAFSATIEYDQDGYVGTLTRDDTTFAISGSEVKNVQKTVNATKNYSGLARNDMSLIDKAYNGLQLSSVEWIDQATGQTVRGFTEGTPGPYSCIAHYTGIKTSRVGGYSGSVTYSGTVTKQVQDECGIRATYLGAQIVEPQAQSSTTDNAGKENAITIAYVFIPITIALIAAIALWLFYPFMKKRKKNNNTEVQK